MTDSDEIRKVIADRITQAYQDHEDPHDAAQGVILAIQDAECTICPNDTTVGMVRELLRCLGKGDAKLGSHTFRTHIEPLARAIAASPLRPSPPKGET